MNISRILIPLVLAAAVAWTSLGPSPAWSITVGEEEALSREFLQMVRQQLPLVEDPAIVDYVNRIGNRILTGVPPQPFNYRFYVVDEHVYNAFASPAGHIFINRGLISALEDESELAGIIAHEIAHVTARHISDRIERSKKIGAATLAGIVAGALIGATGGSAAGQALTVGTLAASQSATLAYSREDEIQADQLGLGYMRNAGYSAKGLMRAMQIIRSRQWFGDVPNYLMTHPASDDRMAYIDSWIESNDIPSRDLDPFAFRKMQTRLDALHGDAQTMQGRLQQRLAESPQDPLVQYALAVFQNRTGHREEAVIHMKKALTKRPFDADFITELGRIYYQSGLYDQALSTLESAENLTPYLPDRAYLLGMSRMQAGQLQRAAWTLENLIARRPDYLPAYFSLGEIYNRQGKLGEAHYYLGDYYGRKGNLKNAFFHLNRALESTDDPEKKKKIQELLGTLEPKKKKTAG